jgi:multidrug resistance efflux pump
MNDTSPSGARNPSKARSADAWRPPALLGEREATRLVATSRIARVVARMVLAGLGILVSSLFLVPWQQNSPGKGRVIAYTPVERQQSIEAPIEGRLARWHVHEGSRVREGDPIADILDNDPDILQRLEREKAALGDRMEAARRRAEAVGLRIDSLKDARTAAVSAAESRVKMAQDRVKQAQKGVEAAEAASSTAELNLERQRGLLEKGLTARRTLELAELEAARTSVELERAKASLSVARSDVAAMRSDQTRAQNDTSASISDAMASRAVAEAEVATADAELARIEVRLARQNTQAIKAPRDGTILRVVARQGTDMVRPGDVLAILVPDAAIRAVELWIDGNDVNLVRPGRMARLQFEGWPAIQASGWPTAAIGTYAGRVAFVDAADDGKGGFRVMILPEAESSWPGPEMLRQGTRVNGWILLDRVSVGYELWRQLNGFPPEWSVAVADDKAEELQKGGVR